MNDKFLDIAKKCKRRLPQIGDVYNHFKGTKIYIVDLAYHTETEEPLVIYKHEDKTWARPLEMFLSKVDTKKYPNVKQYYRLERDLPWNIKESIEFKTLVEDLSYSELFEDFSIEEIQNHVLYHYYL